MTDCVYNSPLYEEWDDLESMTESERAQQEDEEMAWARSEDEDQV
jgi:hypothetical protein